MSIRHVEQQYILNIKDIFRNGEDILNERTDVVCRTKIGHRIDINFDKLKGRAPVLTIRKFNYKLAIGEMIAYLRGYKTLEQLHSLGVKSWDANANNPKWLDSIYNKDPGNDLGYIYGAAGNKIPHYEFGRQEQNLQRLWIYQGFQKNILEDIIKALQSGKDDRGLIWSFWKPEMFHMGCLRPCMYEHQFSIVNGKLYLNSTQRSSDTLLGNPANILQCWFLLWVMSEISGLKPARATLNIVNSHIYTNQLDVLTSSKMLDREPNVPPFMKCRKPITVDALLGRCENPEDNLHPDDFYLEEYHYYPAVKFPFTV